MDRKTPSPAHVGDLPVDFPGWPLLRQQVAYVETFTALELVLRLQHRQFVAVLAVVEEHSYGEFRVLAPAARTDLCDHAD